MPQQLDVALPESPVEAPRAAPAPDRPIDGALVRPSPTKITPQLSRFGPRWLAVLGLLLSGTGLVMLARINVDIPVGTLIMGMVVLAAGVGLGMMPIMSGGLAAVPAESAASASSFNTLTQRVSQSLGLGILNAYLTSAGAQFLADRSALLGGGADPQVAAVAQQGSAGLLGLYQQMQGMAQTDAYSHAFFTIGLICLAGAVFALFLRSRKPDAAPAAVAH